MSADVKSAEQLQSLQVRLSYAVVVGQSCVSLAYFGSSQSAGNQIKIGTHLPKIREIYKDTPFP